MFFKIHRRMIGSLIWLGRRVVTEGFRRVGHCAGLLGCACWWQPLAGRLLVPYWGWVCYVTYRNAGFWWLHRG